MRTNRRRYTFTKKWVFGYVECVIKCTAHKFAVGETSNLLNYLNEMKEFAIAVLTVEAFA